MDMSGVIFATAWILFIYLLCSFIYSKLFGLRLPPGPTGIPILGYMPFISRQTHEEFTKLSKKYGSIFSLKLGNKLYIILNDWNAIQTAFVDKADTFSGRPNHLYFNVFEDYRGIARSEGDIWKYNRRLSLSGLRDLGFGKNILEPRIQLQIDDLCQIIDKNRNDSIHITPSLFFVALNIIWEMTAGRQFLYDDPEGKMLLDIVRNFLNLIGTHKYFFIPKIIRKITGLGQEQEVKLLNCFSRFRNFCIKEITRHEANNSDNAELNDLIDVFLYNTREKLKRGYTGIETKEDNLVMVAMDLFIAGVDTTSNTLGWGFIYLAVNQDIQKKLHEELDRVIGMSRTPTWADRNSLPYLNATIYEIQRLACILPLGLSHRTTKQTTLLGYDIPKDAIVLQNMWKLFRDPALWGNDPHVMRPERFLNGEGKMEKPDYLTPFSIGPRTCPGESLAKMELFLILATLLQRYHFAKPPGAPDPELRAPYGFVLIPPAYKLKVTRRCET